jgi:hypothetical protein
MTILFFVLRLFSVLDAISQKKKGGNRVKELYLITRGDVDLNNLTEEQEQALMYCLLKAYVKLTEAEKEEQKGGEE